MRGGGEPRGEMDIVADVALVGDERRSGVQAGTHPYRAGRERRGELARGLDRPRRGREGEEERVALRVHLDAAVCRGRLADQPPVLGERRRIGLGAELVQQRGRALDVGEEKGDRAAREIRRASARNHEISLRARG